MFGTGFDPFREILEALLTPVNEEMKMTDRIVRSESTALEKVALILVSSVASIAIVMVSIAALPALLSTLPSILTGLTINVNFAPSIVIVL